jgi:hypothetical protein
MKSLIAILSLFTVALALPLQAAPKTEKSLYERLGGVFAIAAVVDHFSDAVVQNPIVGKTSQNRPSGNGTRRTSTGYRASSSCEPCGSARSPAGRSNSRQPSQVETQPQLQPALLRLLAIISQYFIGAERGSSLLSFTVFSARARRQVFGSADRFGADRTLGRVGAARE